nr:uncharacterized protein LOC113713500 [Coffea arabica]XP_027093034.1 uncharacterized protein LOC113713500 [Coffea arabica]
MEEEINRNPMSLGEGSSLLQAFTSTSDKFLVFMAISRRNKLCRIAGGPFIATSYDYDAPPHEYDLAQWPSQVSNFFVEISSMTLLLRSHSNCLIALILDILAAA